MSRKGGPKLNVFKPSEEGLEQALGALEAKVMGAVWNATDALCVEDVRTELAKGKPVAYTTVMTTLDRLYKKGFLDRKRQGKAYYYTARVTRSELGTNVTKQVIDGLLTTFAEPAISYFVEALGDSDPSNLDSLAELIEKKRKERRAEE